MQILTFKSMKKSLFIEEKTYVSKSLKGLAD